MAQGKQTPRQKMINLMYLVFIAMLAMQIDQEIIQSYNDTNQTLTNTRGLVEQKNDKIFEKTLEAKAANAPETYTKPLEDYRGLKARANDLVSFIEGIKTDLKKEAEYADGVDVSENFAALNDTEPSSTKFFAGADENSPSKTAIDLKAKIEALKSYIKQTFGNSDMKTVADRANKTLVTEFANGQTIKNKDWLQYKFYGQPVIAALSNLEVIQSEARNIQSDALMIILQEKVEADIKFDAYQAIVSAPTSVIMGETAPVKVSIGNYSSNVPGLSMPGLSVQNGQGVANLNTNSLGEKSFSGTISFTDLNGKVIPLPYSHTYNVVAGAKEVAFESGALLSADKMQVLYRGLPNPISGSILGANNAQTTLSASGAGVSKTGAGTWVVTPGSGNQTTLTISGKGPKGENISKAFTFRIKNVPPPIGLVQGRNVVSMPASSIPNQRVSADMPDFDFPVSFVVNSFMFKAPGKAAMLVNGNSMASVSNLTKGLRAGDIAYIFNIQASASGLGNQQLKNIGNVIINVQ
jgi:gliding motility-associated protein GldM